MDLEIAGRDVIVCPVPLDGSDGTVARFRSILAPEETARASRFRFDSLERSYILSRGALRVLLARWTGASPQSIRFSYGPQGKPSLLPSGDGIQFNASHSGDLALFAFTIGRELGVDVEKMRPMPDMQDVALRFFSAEEAAELMALPAGQREKAFFRCWTRKEAYIKATGEGLSADLRSFRVTLRPGESPRWTSLAARGPVAQPWTLHNLTLPPRYSDYSAALAYNDTERPLRLLPLVTPAEPPGLKMEQACWKLHVSVPRSLFGILLCACTAWAADSFHFAILGDRTGEARAGVYEQVWREVAAEKPSFVVSVGDTIEGLNDRTALAQWSHMDELLKPFRLFELYLTPGNHDVWSSASERLFLKHARGLHYSFDYEQAHFTILDNSRSEKLSAEELDFLEADLKAHAAQPWKFVISHRPSWLANVALQDTTFRLHRIARQYGVQYVIAGHVHQMLHFQLEGVTYVSMASSGGHLRSTGAYDDGWFYGHALVAIHGKVIEFEIKETGPPHGEGRTTKLADWGMLGLTQKQRSGRARAR